MRARTVFVALVAVALLAVSVMGSVAAAGNPMKLIGALNPWKDGQFSNVAAEDARHVAFLGS